MAKISSTYRSKPTEGDELASFAEKALSYVQEKPREVALAAGAVAAVVILLLVASFVSDRSARKQVLAVTGAIGRYAENKGGDDAGLAAISDELEGVSRKYGSSDLGGQALFFLGGALGREGKHQEAAAIYQEVAGNFSDNETLSNSALLGAAYSYAAAGSEEEAIEQFRRLLALQGPVLPRSQIRLELANLLRSNGNLDEASTEYRLIIEEYPGSTQAGEAQKALSVIAGS